MSEESAPVQIHQVPQKGKLDKVHVEHVSIANNQKRLVDLDYRM